MSELFVVDITYRSVIFAQDEIEAREILKDCQRDIVMYNLTDPESVDIRPARGKYPRGWRGDSMVHHIEDGVDISIAEAERRIAIEKANKQQLVMFADESN